MPIVNISNEEYSIQPDERIAQMIVVNLPEIKIRLTDKLSETTRGEGGFGSTGTK